MYATLTASPSATDSALSQFLQNLEHTPAAFKIVEDTANALPSYRHLRTSSHISRRVSRRWNSSGSLVSVVDAFHVDESPKVPIRRRAMDDSSSDTLRRPDKSSQSTPTRQQRRIFTRARGYDEK